MYTHYNARRPPIKCNNLFITNLKHELSFVRWVKFYFQNFDFTENFHRKFPPKIFTENVHRKFPPRIFTENFHREFAPRIFTENFHREFSPKICTENFHREFSPKRFSPKKFSPIYRALPDNCQVWIVKFHNCQIR